MVFLIFQILFLGMLVFSLPEFYQRISFIECLFLDIFKMLIDPISENLSNTFYNDKYAMTDSLSFFFQVTARPISYDCSLSRITSIVPISLRTIPLSTSHNWRTNSICKSSILWITWYMRKMEGQTH
jgi:hypothetical protein